MRSQQSGQLPQPVFLVVPGRLRLQSNPVCCLSCWTEPRHPPFRGSLMRMRTGRWWGEVLAMRCVSATESHTQVCSMADSNCGSPAPPSEMWAPNPGRWFQVNPEPYWVPSRLCGTLSDLPSQTPVLQPQNRVVCTYAVSPAAGPYTPLGDQSGRLPFGWPALPRL